MFAPKFNNLHSPIYLIFILAFLTSCERPNPSASNQNLQHAIQIKGSDTMVNLAQAWAEEYMRQHPGVLIAVTGGGSGTGIAALLTNTCDIAISSRLIKEKEVQQAKSNNVEPVEFKVALDGLAVVVSPKNPINQLTVDQLAEIFSGKIKNWKEVGGDNLPIVLLSREVNSGTHVYFKEHVLQRGDTKVKIEFDEGALLMPSSQAIADEIAYNPNAIGYYGMGYSNPNQKILAVAKDKDSPYILPAIESIVKGEYYISRPLLMYTNGQPEASTKNFIDFILSEEGQRIVRQIDFVPVK